MRPQRIRVVAVLLFSAAGGVLLARCGAQNTDAPVQTTTTVSNGCSIQATMPAFYALLTDPSQPLQGLAEVIDALSSGDGGVAQGQTLLEVLQNAIQGLANFANDPAENDGTCLDFTAPEEECNDAPCPFAPLCTLNDVTPCESRICALRRALDFGVKDEAASTALQDLQPILAKVIGYLSNAGPGATGVSHYELVSIFQSMAVDEARCPPYNLIDVLDGLLVYLRSNPDCDPNCPGQTMLNDLQALILDPSMKEFLATYTDSNGDQSRASFQALGQLLETALSSMPTNSHYFDTIQSLVNTVENFLNDNNSNGQYDGLIMKINAVATDLKTFLNPTRPGAFNQQFEDVVACVANKDPNQEIVGALYDLLSQPGGTTGNGLDLSDLTTALVSIGQLDQAGVLDGAINAVLASVMASDQDMEPIRELLAQVLTQQNAQEMLPALQTMISAGVVPEFLTFMDDLVYGCKATVTEPQ